MSARLLANDADGFKTIHQILHLANTIGEPILAHAIAQTDRQTLHRAAFQTAISRETFLHDAEGAAFSINIEIAVVFNAEQTTHWHHRVFLRRHGEYIGVLITFAGNFLDGFILITRLALLNKIGILGKACGIHHHRNVIFLRDGIHAAQIGNGYRLATSGITGNGADNIRHIFSACFFNARFQFFQIKITFEIVFDAGIKGFFGISVFYRAAIDL